MNIYERAIQLLCEKLDTMIYFPFKNRDLSKDAHIFGQVKEKYKQIIEETILSLKAIH